ncbi:MAG: HAMP domain-containing sensor histidine kinase [Betaproteobacteria bacterium]
MESTGGKDAAAAIPGPDAQPVAAPCEPDNVGIRQEMNALFGMLSHDLRTPLSAISGWLHLLETGKLDPAGQKRALAKIRSNVDGQVRLLDDALLLARSRSGALELALVLIPVAVPLAAALQAIAPPAAEKGVALRSSGFSATAHVLADPDLLRRSFEILLRRALDATDRGGTVDTRVQVVDSTIVIAIGDDGKGCTMAELQTLRDSLARSGSAYAQALSRIERGMLLVQGLVEAHGGCTEAESDGPGQGMNIIVRLPRHGTN